MSVPTLADPAADWTLADLLDRFGPIPFRRIRQDPAPGTATEQDVVAIHDHEDRLYELVDGVLVEKTVGTQESYLAIVIASVIREFAEEHDLGFVLGADGMARLAPGLVRIPDVSFISWGRIGQHAVPAGPMLNLAPDLGIEVLSPGNTKKEMERKLDDYFDAGMQLVWFVDHRRRNARVFSGREDSVTLAEDDSLQGDPVLPGFSVRLGDLFARLETKDNRKSQS